MVDPTDMTRRRQIPQGIPHQDLLVPIFRQGENVASQPSIHQIRDFAKEQLAQFHPGIKRFTNPHQYPVGLEQQLFERKTQLILRARGLNH